MEGPVEFKVKIEEVDDDNVVTFSALVEGEEVPTEAIDILVATIAAAVIDPGSVKVDAKYAGGPDA